MPRPESSRVLISPDTRFIELNQSLAFYGGLCIIVHRQFPLTAIEISEMNKLINNKNGRVVITSLILLALAGCGGGGGGESAGSASATADGGSGSAGGSTSGGNSSGAGATPVTNTPTGSPIVPPVQTKPVLDYTTVISESKPVGQTIDLKSLNLMPLPVNGRWDYEVVDGTGKVLHTGVRSVAALSTGSSATVVLTESEAGTPDKQEVTTSDTGIFVNYGADTTLPPKARAIIGSIREYAFPTYAIGEVRTVSRKGEWDQDIDGDGSNEVFSLEYTQTYRGFETIPMAGATINAARFSNAFRLVITYSKDGATSGYIAKEEAFLSSGIGAVRYVRELRDLQGKEIELSQTWNLTGTENVEPVPETQPTAVAQKIAVAHNDVVYDASRNRYYASVPSLAAQGGNTIATIDPGTGTVTYSSAVGSEPNAMALSASGKYLFVGLIGAGEVVKLSLPSMTVVARIPLTGSPFYGTLVAETISASPTNPEVFAVSLMNRLYSPRHNGVVLVNGTEVLAKRTQGHTGSNLIAFNQEGTGLFGYNNETTEFGLRKISVEADGLVEGIVKPSSGNFGNNSIRVVKGDVLLGSTLYSGADLVQKGQFASASGCAPIANETKIVCLPADTSQSILRVYDIASFAVANTISVSSLPYAFRMKIVAGPAGQFAITSSDTSSAQTALYLINSPVLK